MPKQTGTPPNATADWTLGRMAFQLEAEMESYVLSHSTGYGASGTALVDETAALGDPAAMMLGKEQYALFRFLAGLLGCRRALDVGTFTGLSALAFADGMGPEGKVVTIDRNRAWVDLARKHWESAGAGGRIDARVGEAVDVLAQLAGAGERFDIAFLDVDKTRIQEYFDRTLELLAPRGLLMIDNALWHGWVLDERRTDADTRGMRDFNDRLIQDTRFEVSLLPIADGLTLVRRKH
jgi:predicted O-methyltransferase YrrM